jgi:hypothetical protein
MADAVEGAPHNEPEDGVRGVVAAGEKIAPLLSSEYERLCSPAGPVTSWSTTKWQAFDPETDGGR